MYYGYGDSNGRLNGVDYFHCESGRGSFVSWNKLILPSNSDDTSDALSIGRGCIAHARDVTWRDSIETLSSYLSMDVSDSSLLIPKCHKIHTEDFCSNKGEDQQPSVLKGLEAKEINISTGFEREWWEISRRNLHISDTVLQQGGKWQMCVRQGVLCRQRVAVKSFGDQDVVAQLAPDHTQQVMRRMAQIHHPNLLLFMGAILDHVAGPLVVTELLDRTLQSAHEGRLLEEHGRLPILRDVASALNYLHSQNPPVVHGCVNCSNVFLEALRDGKWKAKLSDFGSANLIQHLWTRKDFKSYASVQKLDEYTAPELQLAIGPNVQYVGSNLPWISQKVDVYSYGVLWLKISPPLNSLSSGSSLGHGLDSWIFQLTTNCTKPLPQDRPTMDEILVQIDNTL